MWVNGGRRRMSEVSSAGAARLGFLEQRYWREVWAQVGRDRLIYAIIFGHMVAVAATAVLLGAPHKLVYFAYATMWLQGLAAVAALYVVLWEIPQSMTADPARPWARLISRIPELTGPRMAAGLMLVLALILMHGSFTAAKNLLSDIGPFRWDAALAQADAWLHGGKDPWRWLQPFFGHHLVTRFVQYMYTAGWVTGLCAVTALVAVSRRLQPYRLRFFLTYLFCWIVLGNVVAGLFMSAGPVYFGEATGDTARFADQLRYLSFSDGMPQSSVDLQQMLWILHERGRAELGTGISAFPSLHVAMSTLFTLIAWKINRRAGLAASAFLVVTMAGSVHLAWHYALDGYVSAALTLAVWLGVGAVERRLAARTA